MAKTPKNLLSTQDVLKRTLLSRLTLIRKTQSGEFPAPVPKKTPKSPNYWKPKDVNQWIDENADWVDNKRRAISNARDIEFLRHQLLAVERACNILECDMDSFVADAAHWKARKVIEHFLRDPRPVK